MSVNPVRVGRPDMPALQSVFWSGCSGWNARKIPTEHYGSVRIALSCALKLRAEHVKASGCLGEDAQVPCRPAPGAFVKTM